MGRIYEYSTEEQRILFPEKFVTNTNYADDYRNKTGRFVKKDIKRSLKETDEISDILDIVYDAIKTLTDLIVLDIHNISNKKINEIRDLFESHQFGYSELGVYGDSIVFAAMDVEL